MAARFFSGGGGGAVPLFKAALSNGLLWSEYGRRIGSGVLPVEWRNTRTGRRHVAAAHEVAYSRCVMCLVVDGAMKVPPLSRLSDTAARRCSQVSVRHGTALITYLLGDHRRRRPISTALPALDANREAPNCDILLENIMQSLEMPR